MFTAQVWSMMSMVAFDRVLHNGGGFALVDNLRVWNVLRSTGNIVEEGEPGGWSSTGRMQSIDVVLANTSSSTLGVLYH